jgi:hypothetical protein
MEADLQAVACPSSQAAQAAQAFIEEAQGWHRTHVVTLPPTTSILLPMTLQTKPLLGMALLLGVGPAGPLPAM